jgi:hypothetical protein
MLGKRQKHTKEVILRMASPEPNTGCWLWAMIGSALTEARLKLEQGKQNAGGMGSAQRK